MRVQACYISTKDNIRADHLRRGDLRAFWKSYQLWLAMEVMDKDREDKMLKSAAVAPLDQEMGLFDVAAGCDNYGKNTHMCNFWSVEKDCRLQDWAQRNVICNPPFSMAFWIMAHFMHCKLRQPIGTSAVFTLPIWITDKFHFQHGQRDGLAAHHTSGEALVLHDVLWIEAQAWCACKAGVGSDIGASGAVLQRD
jgi:hypothetical protein